jgi:hypothetical protein
MTIEAFEHIIAADAHLSGPLERAARGARRQFSLVTEAAVIVLLFPVARYVLTQVGLPWLHEAQRFSELHRQRFGQWIDETYRQYGFDPDEAESAGNALCEELEQTTDQSARAAWERLTDLLKQSPGDG